MAEKELALLEDPSRRREAELLQQQAETEVRQEVELSRMEAALQQQDSADIYAARVRAPPC